MLWRWELWAMHGAWEEIISCPKRGWRINLMNLEKNWVSPCRILRGWLHRSFVSNACCKLKHKYQFSSPFPFAFYFLIRMSCSDFDIMHQQITSSHPPRIGNEVTWGWRQSVLRCWLQKWVPRKDCRNYSITRVHLLAEIGAIALPSTLLPWWLNNVAQ